MKNKYRKLIDKAKKQIIRRIEENKICENFCRDIIRNLKNEINISIQDVDVDERNALIDRVTRLDELVSWVKVDSYSLHAILTI